MNSRMKRSTVLSLGFVTIAAAAAALSPAQAEWDADIRGGINADAEGPFVGAGALTSIGGSRSWYFNPNAEYTAGDTTDVMSVNADFHYDIPTATRWSVWVGAGPTFMTYDPEFGEDDDNDVGVNLLVGTGARQGTVRPFVQAKGVAADRSQVLIAGGIRW